MASGERCPDRRWQSCLGVGSEWCGRRVRVERELLVRRMTGKQWVGGIKWEWKLEVAKRGKLCERQRLKGPGHTRRGGYSRRGPLSYRWGCSEGCVEGIFVCSLHGLEALYSRDYTGIQFNCTINVFWLHFGWRTIMLIKPLSSLFHVAHDCKCDK